MVVARRASAERERTLERLRRALEAERGDREELATQLVDVEARLAATGGAPSGFLIFLK